MTEVVIVWYRRVLDRWFVRQDRKIIVSTDWRILPNDHWLQKV